MNEKQRLKYIIFQIKTILEFMRKTKMDKNIFKIKKACFGEIL
jgi:hypothetical protein